MRIANILNPIKRVFSIKDFIIAVDTLDTTGVSETYYAGNSPLSGFTLQVKEIGGTATSWTVTLKGSLTGDANEFDTILTHTKADVGNGKPIFSGTNLFPCLHYLIEVEALDLGTATEIEIRSLGVN